VGGWSQHRYWSAVLENADRTAGRLRCCTALRSGSGICRRSIRPRSAAPRSTRSSTPVFWRRPVYSGWALIHGRSRNAWVMEWPSSLCSRRPFQRSARRVLTFAPRVLDPSTPRAHRSPVSMPLGISGSRGCSCGSFLASSFCYWRWGSFGRVAREAGAAGRSLATWILSSFFRCSFRSLAPVATPASDRTYAEEITRGTRRRGEKDTAPVTKAAAHCKSNSRYSQGQNPSWSLGLKEIARPLHSGPSGQRPNAMIGLDFETLGTCDLPPSMPTLGVTSRMARPSPLPVHV